MKYPNSQPEVSAYTKVIRCGISLYTRYYDRYGYLRYYVPGFIVKTQDRFYLIRNQGRRRH